MTLLIYASKLKSPELYEQLFISLSNFLIVYGSSLSLPLNDQEFLLTTYTITIGLFPFYYGLVVQPFLQISFTRGVSVGYPLFLLFVIFAIAFPYIIFSYFWRLNHFDPFQLWILIFFLLSFYACDCSRRLFFRLGSIQLSFAGACFILIIRSSVLFSDNVTSFLWINIFANLFYCILAFFFVYSLLLSPRSNYSLSLESFSSLASRHLSLWSLFAPISILGFLTSSIPLIYASKVPPLDFLLFSKVRSLFSLFNPILEYFDGYLASVPSASALRTISLYRTSARVLFFAGLSFASILSFISSHGALFDSLLLSSFPLRSDDQGFPLALPVFLIGASSVFGYVVRVYAALTRRIGFLRSELYSNALSVSGLLVLFLRPSLYSAAALFLSLSFLQLCYYLYFLTNLAREQKSTDDLLK